MAIPTTEIWTNRTGNGSDCPEPLLDPSDWVVTLTLCTANLSILSAAFLLLIFQRISTTKHDLVICFIQCLAICDLLFCVGMDMGIAHYANTFRGTTDALCMAQSVICTFCDLVSYCYVLYIVIHIFSVDVLKSYWMLGKQTKRLCHSAAVIIPGMITISAASVGALGDAQSRFGSWCWIKGCLTDKQRLLWMLFTKQIWEILIYVLSACLIVISIWMKKRNERIAEQPNHRGVLTSHNGHEECALTGSGKTRKKPRFNVMVWVLFYFYFTRIWGTTRNFVRIIGLAIGLTPVPGFVLLDEHFFIHAQCIGDSMQGTLNFLMFCYFDGKVWRHVRDKINRNFLDKICFRKHYDNIEFDS